MGQLETDSSESHDSLNVKDFLYIDNGRIASYYAQLFEGKLSSVTLSKKETEETKKHRETNAKVLKFGRAITQRNADERSESIDPHHHSVILVLAYLNENGVIGGDIKTAKTNSLVLVKGTMHFYNGEGTSQLIRMIEFLPTGSMGLDDTAKLGVHVVKAILGDQSLPSGFRLELETGDVVAGLLQKQFMIDDPTSYTMRYGSHGIEDIYVIGIVEHIGPKPKSPTQMLEAAQILNEGFRKIYFNDGDTSLTPLVVFRMLEENQA